MRLSNTRRRQGEAANPALHLSMSHGCELNSSPPRPNVTADDPLIAVAGLRRQISLRVEPLVSPCSDRDAGARRVDVGAVTFGVLDAGEVALGVDLARKGLVSLLAARVAVPRDIAKLGVLSLVMVASPLPVSALGTP